MNEIEEVSRLIAMAAAVFLGGIILAGLTILAVVSAFA